MKEVDQAQISEEIQVLHRLPEVKTLKVSVYFSLPCYGALCLMDFFHPS